MIKDYPVRYVARMVIEFDTAFHVGVGDGDDLVDADIITDANGLAAIPGDSIAGVLRAAWRTMPGADQQQVDDVFGGRMKDDQKDGHYYRGSRLLVSWGHVHDSDNVPVVGVLDAAKLKDDVLANALAPDRRDHVRLGHHGAADDKGLFSENCVCAGHRFTFELELIGKSHERKDLWSKLLGLLDSAVVRFGGKTRRGLGAFHVVSVHQKAFDLRQKNQFTNYTALDPDLSRPATILTSNDVPRTISHPSDALVVTMPLMPSAYWMFGGGDERGGAVGDADMAPVFAGRIVWEAGKKGKYKEYPLLPGSAIKGAIAHRVAFYFNILTGQFADDLAANYQNCEEGTGFKQANSILGAYAAPLQNLAIRELFGMCKTNDDSQISTGQRGRVLIDDILVDAAQTSQLVPHAKLDRFSGGVLNLFNERPFWQGELPSLRIVVLEKTKITDCNIRIAFYKALMDLAEGRLALGGGSGRGLGYFKVKDDDSCAWDKDLKAWAEEVSS